MECLHQPGDYGCIDHKGVDAFLNNLDVKKDLNADTTKVWNLCNNTVSQIYERDPDGSLKTYETLLTRERSQNLRIVLCVLYSGLFLEHFQQEFRPGAQRNGLTR